MLQSMTRHKSRLERDKEQAAADRKAQKAASKAAASPALPRGDWTPEVHQHLSAATTICCQLYLHVLGLNAAEVHGDGTAAWAA